MNFKVPILKLAGDAPKPSGTAGGANGGGASDEFRPQPSPTSNTFGTRARKAGVDAVKAVASEPGVRDAAGVAAQHARDGADRVSGALQDSRQDFNEGMSPIGTGAAQGIDAAAAGAEHGIGGISEGLRGAQERIGGWISEGGRRAGAALSAGGSRLGGWIQNAIPKPPEQPAPVAPGSQISDQPPPGWSGTPTPAPAPAPVGGRFDEGPRRSGPAPAPTPESSPKPKPKSKPSGPTQYGTPPRR